MSELSAIYAQDFYTWAMRNAELLRQGRLQEIDVEHLAEELESMGRRERHELVSRLKILLGHLLKWQFQPAYRSSSWRGSIVEQRLQVRDLLALVASSMCTFPVIYGILAFWFEKDARYGGDCSSLSPLS